MAGLILTLPWSDNLIDEDWPVPISRVSIWQDLVLFYSSVDEPPSDAGPDWEDGQAGASVYKLRISRKNADGTVVLIIGDADGDQDRFVRDGANIVIALTPAETTLPPGMYYAELRRTNIVGSSAHNKVLSRRFIHILNSPFVGSFEAPPSPWSDFGSLDVGLLAKREAGDTAITTYGIGAGLEVQEPDPGVFELVATGGGGGGSGNLDGGHADSVYGGGTPIDGGGA